MVRSDISDTSSDPIKIDMNIPSISEFVGIVRLAVSGIATRMNFTIEEIEDIKIAVSEACTNAVQYAYDPKLGGKIHVECNLHQTKLEIIISDYGKGFDIQGVLAGKHKPRDMDDKLGLGLGLTFIKSLMDEADFHSEYGKGTTIKMAKFAPIREQA